MVASKHDGFRVIARKDGAKVRLYSRPGNDLTFRFRLIVESMARLRSRSCIIDGEAVACNDNGLASFDRIRYRRHDATVFLYAFDLIELNGDDLRRDPLEVRKEQSVEPLSCWGFVRPRGGAKNSMISIFYARGGRVYTN
jgi:bifunctional non-homologous end joining protein LigD